ncbi:MAG TPA: hypothetical protein VF338_12705 [Leptolinea sp.]
MFRKFKFLLMALIALFIAGSTYAFAAANTWGGNNPADVGYVAEAITGYKIENIEIFAGSGDAISKFEFDVTALNGGAVATWVSIQTRGTGTAWDDCTLNNAASPIIHATCDAGGTLTLTAYTSLNVIASSNNGTPGTIIHLVP